MRKWGPTAGTAPATSLNRHSRSGAANPVPPTRFSRYVVPVGTPASSNPSAPRNDMIPANRCGAWIAGATASLPLTSFLTSSYDLRNWKAIGKARWRVPVRSRIPRGTVANRHRAPATLNPHHRPKTGRYATRHGGKGPTAHSAPARQRNCGRHDSHGKARSTRGNAPGSGNTTRRTAHRHTHAARTAQTHHATGTTPRTRKHERNTVLLAASRIHGHCALPGRDLISTTIRNKGDGLCPRRWRPKEPMLS